MFFKSNHQDFSKWPKNGVSDHTSNVFKKFNNFLYHMQNNRHEDKSKKTLSDLNNTKATDSNENNFEKNDSDQIEDNFNQIEHIISHKDEDDGSRYYLVKIKGKSYNDLKWLKSEDIDQEIRDGKLKNYEKKYKNLPPTEPYFDSAYCVPEKILTIKETPNGKKYFIKWKKLDYCNSTWEDEDFISKYPTVFENYKNRITPPKNDIITRESLKNLVFQPCNIQEITQITNKRSIFQEYQVACFNFFLKAWCEKRNVAVSSEKGFDSVLPLLLFLNKITKDFKIRGSFLFVLPLKIISEWERRIQECTDLTLLKIAGNKENQKLIQKYEMITPQTNKTQFQCILAPFEGFSENKTFDKIDWDCVIINETFQTTKKTYRRTKFFSAFESMKIDFFVIFTTFPILAKKDYWQIVHFINPLMYADRQKFRRKYGKLVEQDQRDKFFRDTSSFILSPQGCEFECLSRVPEIILKCPLTNYQKIFMKNNFIRHVELIYDFQKKIETVHFKRFLQEILLICNHPFLINGAEKSIMLQEKKKYIKQGVCENPDNIRSKILISSSGKFIILEKLLTKHKKENLRMCIISQNNKILDLLEQFLQHLKFTYCRLDSSIRGSRRNDVINNFNSVNSKDFVFLVSAKGNNEHIIIKSDVFLIFDSDLNPDNDNKLISAFINANEHTHSATTKIYRLITDNSFECFFIESFPFMSGKDFNQWHNLSSEEQKVADNYLRYSAIKASENTAPPDYSKINIDKLISQSIIRVGNKITSKKSILNDINIQNSLNTDAQFFWSNYCTTGDDSKALNNQPSNKKSSNISQINNSDESEIDDEFDTKKLVDFETDFLSFGYGRWEFYSTKYHLSKTYIMKFENLIMELLLKDSKGKYEIIENAYKRNSENDVKEESFAKNQLELVEQFVKGQSKINKLERLEMLYIINVAVGDGKPSQVLTCEINQKKPAEWWTDRDDITLMLHISKEGFPIKNGVKFSNSPNPSQALLSQRVKSLAKYFKKTFLHFYDINPSRQSKNMINFTYKSLKNALQQIPISDEKNIIETISNMGVFNSKQIISLLHIPNSKASIVEEFVLKFEKSFEKAIRGNDDDFLDILTSKKITKNAQQIIFEKLSLMKKINALVNFKGFSSEDQKLLQYLKVEGYNNIDKEAIIIDRFGDNPEVKLFAHLHKILDGDQNQIHYDNETDNSSHDSKISKIKNQNEQDSSSDTGFKDDIQSILPLKISGALKVINFGKVVYDRPGFHNSRYLYMDGYTAEKLYISLKNPKEKVWYVAKIVDTGGPYPDFIVQMKDDPSIKYIGNVPTAPWRNLLKDIDKARNDGRDTGRHLTVSGPEYFGLSSPKVIKIMQSMPDAEKCSDFIGKKSSEKENTEEETMLPRVRNKKLVDYADGYSSYTDEYDIYESSDISKKESGSESLSLSSKNSDNNLPDKTDKIINLSSSSQASSSTESSSSESETIDDLVFTFDKLTGSFAFNQLNDENNSYFILDKKIADKAIRKKYVVPHGIDPIEFVRNIDK